MRQWVGWMVGVLCSCAATPAGAPASGEGGVPMGVELARSKLSRDPNPQLPAANAQQFGADNRAFALDLYHTLAKQSGNLFLSPYSVSAAVAMAYAGAKGDTASELATALHFVGQPMLHAAFDSTDLSLGKRKDATVMTDPSNPTKGDGFRLNIVNQAWGRKGYAFLDSYLDVLATNYAAGLFLVNFTETEASRGLINQWVADQTEQRIRDLLPEGSIQSDTALVLTNAIYFKASWLEDFDAAKTAAAPFNAPSGQHAVPMMHALTELRYARVSGYQAVEIPYLSPDVGMLLVLPPMGSFDAAVSGFDAALFDALSGGLINYQVTLSMPKWTFESESNLKSALQTLGVQKAFEPGLADFSGMDGMPGNIYVDGIYHKAFVSVDEHGTEAAAATAVVSRDTSLPPSVEIAFDRPFIFAVYDRPTRQILFLGHLVEPG